MPEKPALPPNIFGVTGFGEATSPQSSSPAQLLKPLVGEPGAPSQATALAATGEIPAPTIVIIPADAKQPSIISIDLGIDAATMSDMMAATDTLPQYELPKGVELIGGVPAKLDFGLQGEKPIGYVPRYLVAKETGNGVITRNHLASVFLNGSEALMRNAEATFGKDALRVVVDTLEARAKEWASSGDSSLMSAAEYVYTVKGFWETPTQTPAEVEETDVQAYLQKVPDSIRARVAQRMIGIFKDKDSIPRNTYAATDEGRRYWRAVYSLMQVRDNIALNPQFESQHPHLVVNDEKAMDTIYETLRAIPAASDALQALSELYIVLTGSPNGPSYSNLVKGEIGFGRNSAARYAQDKHLPIYNANSVGLGRTVLPTMAVTIDGTANAVFEQLMDPNKLYTPNEFAALFAANKLLEGIPEAQIQGMIDRISENGSYVDMIMTAVDKSRRGQPRDGLYYMDFMASAVHALSMVDLARERPKAVTRGMSHGLLYLAPEVTPELVEGLAKAQGRMVDACTGLAKATGKATPYTNEHRLAVLTSTLQGMAESGRPIGKEGDAFAALAQLDFMGSPKATLVMEHDQQGAPDLRMSWAIAPALIRRTFEGFTNPWSDTKGQITAYDTIMVPYQGVVPRQVTEAELAQIHEPSVSSVIDIEEIVKSGGKGKGVRLPYHKSLVISS